MQELFYFASANLLVRIKYHQAENSLRYATHRKTTVRERVMIEQYLLATFALKTEYQQRHPALFAYLGIEKRLIQAWEKFQHKDAWHELDKKEKTVNDSVSDLINQSMQNYYFEQIGDTILEARMEKAGVKASLTTVERRGRRKTKLEELVKAYNVYAGQEITVDEIIPSELKSCFGIPAKTEYSRMDTIGR